MKLLITGINGFVAEHFLELLSSKEIHDFDILGVGRSNNSNSINNTNIFWEINKWILLLHLAR